MDVFQTTCLSCKQRFKPGQLVTRVEPVYLVKASRIELTEHGGVAHLNCPPVED